MLKAQLHRINVFAAAHSLDNLERLVRNQMVRGFNHERLQLAQPIARPGKRTAYADGLRFDLTQAVTNGAKL
ncbi:hypothetical protein GCM10009081_22130 [Brevundimonas nasdae]